MIATITSSRDFMPVIHFNHAVRLHIHGSDTDTITIKLLSAISGKLTAGCDTDNAHGYNTVMTRMQPNSIRVRDGYDTDSTNVIRIWHRHDTRSTNETRTRYGRDKDAIRTQGHELRVRNPRTITRIGFHFNLTLVTSVVLFRILCQMSNDYAQCRKITRTLTEQSEFPLSLRVKKFTKHGTSSVYA